MAVRWREDGKWRTTTRIDWEEAKTWAKGKAKQLDAASGAQWVTAAGREQLEWLRRIAGGAEGVPAVLSHLEAAGKALGGELGRLAEAARWWASQGGETMRGVTMKVAVAEFMADYEGKHPKITVRGVKSELGAFAGKFPEVLLEHVTAEMLGAHVRRGGVANRTVRNRHSYWILFFNGAIARQWWPRSAPVPIAGVKREKPVRKSPEIFTPEEGARLLVAVAEREPQHLAYLLVAGWLGCRPSECQRLLWEDFDFEEGVLHVRAEVARKVMAERWVPVPGRLLALLKECRDARRKGGGKREHVCRLKAQNMVSEVARGIGLKWSIDVLRHSRITYRLQETHDIGKVAEESGNSPSEIRASYKRPIPPGRWELWGKALDGVVVRDWVPPGNARWTAGEIALLGTAGDAAVARALGRPTASVLQKRLRVGIGRRRRE